jgi:hypothetical protein
MNPDTTHAEVARLRHLLKKSFECLKAYGGRLGVEAELGPDEVIQEGDEKFVGRGPWLTQAFYIGEKAGKYPLIRFRTRRPLPKREGEQPYCSAFPCEGSLAGVPLEDELSAIEDGNPWIDPSKNILICIRYLRDEIEALKKNQK